MSREYRKHNQYRCCNHGYTCFFRSYIQLEKSAGTRIFHMDKPYGIGSNLQRDNVGPRNLQVPEKGHLRMRISGNCFCRCSGLFDNT